MPVSVRPAGSPPHLLPEGLADPSGSAGIPSGATSGPLISGRSGSCASACVAVITTATLIAAALAAAVPAGAMPQPSSSPASPPSSSPIPTPPAEPVPAARPAAAAPTPARAPATAAPQIARDGWKDCSFNDRLIRCLDQAVDGGLRIVWIDGLRNLYRPEPRSQAGGGALLIDRQGGRWRREVLVQGNTVLTHLTNGNRIVVPLRFPCRPPLKGEVGYCRY